MVMVTVPPDMDGVIPVPVGPDADGLLTEIAVEGFVVVGESPSVTTATVPLAIKFAFIP